MLFINAGIMVSVYIGVRVFEYYGNKKSLTAKKNPQLGKLATTKQHEHHLKVSTAAMGLTAISHIYPPLIPLNIAVISYTSVPIFNDAKHSLLKEQRIKNDLLTSIVNVMCLVTGEYFAATVQSSLYHFGNKIVSKSQKNSNQSLTELFEQAPSKVWILKESVEIEIALETLHVNDIIVVKGGEIIAIDGTISDGMAMIDEHALTGEAMPVEKGMGEKVFAATLVVSGKLYVKVEKTGSETSIAKLGEILNHTADFKTNLQMKGEQWSNKVAKPLLGFSLLSLPLLGASSATAILYSVPSNSIKAFTSLHTFNHLTLLSKKGILIKDGHALEELMQIDTILFDKTGTLTTGEPQVGKIIRCGDLGEDEILIYAAAAEHRLAHPIAHAILNHAKEQHLDLPDIADADYKIGYGVTVTLNDQVIKVGSARFMDLEDVVIPATMETVKENSQEQGYSLVMVAINQQLQGAIEIQPQVRAEVKQTINRLRQHGIKHFAIVSGDHKHPTQKLAEELDMDDYFYEVLPNDKANLVEQLQKQGHRVCFVGDGINDAIAMKKANVSISLQGASFIATDMAQVVLMDGSLKNLDYVFDISKQLNRNLKQSLSLSTGFGVMNFTGASLLQVGINTSTMLFSLFFTSGIAHTMLPLHRKSVPPKIGDGK